MNVVYWLIVAALLLLAFIVIIPPLLRKTDVEAADSDQRNLTIAKERIKELKQQLSAGELSQIQFDEQYAELELVLGDDLDDEAPVQGSSIQGRWVVPVLVMVIPVSAIFTYFTLGEPNALAKAKIQQTEQAQKMPPNVNAMVTGLAKRLEEDPTNVKGWLMLGRSYKVLKKYKMAAYALEQAYRLSSDDVEVMLQYADALAMAKGGSLAGKSSELVFKAIAKDPGNITGLWLAGMANAEQGDYSQALIHWRTLEKLLPAGSESMAEVQSLMAMAQAKVGGESETVVVAETETAVSVTEVKADKAVAAVSITVKASITDAIKAKVNGQDTVFIYARALTGPPMPLAIVRKKVSDLPITVTLDDAMAMMPTMKLSNFKHVKVIARVSKSGTAMQQKGDFVGSIDVQDLSNNPSLMIIINKEIK